MQFEVFFYVYDREEGKERGLLTAEREEENTKGTQKGVVTYSDLCTIVLR